MAIPSKRRHPMTFEKACNALHLVNVLGWSQTQAAIFLRLNVGQVCHVINRRRFPTARPVAPDLRLAA